MALFFRMVKFLVRFYTKDCSLPSVCIVVAAFLKKFSTWWYCAENTVFVKWSRYLGSNNYNQVFHKYGDLVSYLKGNRPQDTFFSCVGLSWALQEMCKLWLHLLIGSSASQPLLWQKYFHRFPKCPQGVVLAPLRTSAPVCFHCHPPGSGCPHCS